uniref:DnaJ (Hsp40) homolog, subfamily C, member 28 n=1 Tax=Cyclopterus lumpus TaxID=8103 RepID=A0A8C2ZKA5_CYCLU
MIIKFFFSEMSCTFHLLVSCSNVYDGRSLLVLSRGFLLLRALSSMHQISRRLQESYRLLRLPDKGHSSPVQVKEAKIYHPDSGAPTADAMLFAQVEEAYRAVLAHQSKTKQPDGGKWKMSTSSEVQHFHTDTTSATRVWVWARPASLSVSTGRFVSTGRPSSAAERSRSPRLWNGYLIQESMGRGDFRNLSGAGKPLNKFEYNPYADPMTHNLNRILIDNGYQPAWVVAQRNIREAAAQIRNRLLAGRAGLGDPPNPKHHRQWEQLCASVEEDLVKLNKTVDNYNLIAPMLNMEQQGEREKERQMRKEEKKRANAVTKPTNTKQGLVSWMKDLLRLKP